MALPPEDEPLTITRYCLATFVYSHYTMEYVQPLYSLRPL